MYGDFVLQVDDVVGQIRKAIKDSGEADNTILIFTSDNGCSPRADFEELAKVDHNPSAIYRGNKADLYEGGHRVPYIVEWGTTSNRINRGSATDVTICTTDLFATCADVAGYKVGNNEGEDSFSLLPLLIGNEAAFTRENTVHHSINGSFALREGDWKLLLSDGSAGWSYPTPSDIKGKNLKLPALQLFNLKNDPSETTNVAAQNPTIVKAMTKKMAELISNGRSTDGSVVTNDGDPNWAQAKTILEMASK